MERVHITLSKDVLCKRTITMRDIVDVAYVKRINMPRLRKYGILTCNINHEDIELVKKLPSVEKVELNTERVIIDECVWAD